MSNTLEPNFNGLPKPTDWKKVIVPLQQANEKEFRGATLLELGDNLNIEMSINAQRVPAVPPGALVAGPADREVFMEIKVPGSWTWGTNPPLTNAQGDISTFWWDMSDWKKNDSAALPIQPVNGVVLKNNDNATSGGTIYNALDPFVNIPEPVTTELYAGDGSYTAAGNPSTSLNWITTRPIAISESGGEKFEVIGIQDSSLKLIKLYVASDILNQNATNLSIPIGTSAEYTTPPGFSKMLINVTRGANVGANIPNSPFKNSFKLLKGGKEKLKTSAIDKKDRIETDQLHNIENAISGTTNYLVGNGAPGFMYGLDNIEYLDTSTGRVYRKKNNLWDNGQTPENFEIDFLYPELFTYRPSTIYKQRNGIYQLRGYENNTTFVQKDILSMLPAYVDCVNGLNTNDGALFSPFKSILHAYNAGYRLIICRQGWYDRNTGLTDFIDTDSRLHPLIIIPYKREKVNFFSGDHGNFFGWTADSNLFRTARTNVRSIVDSSIEDKLKGAFEFKKCINIEECRLTYKSWFTDGASLWINTGGALAPSPSIKIILNMTIGTFTFNVNTPYVYLDSLNVYIDSPRGAIAIRSNNITQVETKAYLKNVISYLNTNADGIAFRSIKFAFAQNSGAYGCARDAHNYHSDYEGFEKMRFIEVNGWSFDTGKDSPDQSSSNGSTAHDGIQGIRLGGSFDTSRGGTIIDVNPGTKTLNFVAQAKNPTISEGTTAAFQTQNSAIQWNYGIYAKGTRALTAETEGIMYIDKDSIVDGAITGNVIFSEG